MSLEILALKRFDFLIVSSIITAKLVEKNQIGMFISLPSLAHLLR